MLATFYAIRKEELPKIKYKKKKKEKEKMQVLKNVWKRYTNLHKSAPKIMSIYETVIRLCRFAKKQKCLFRGALYCEFCVAFFENRHGIQLIKQLYI